jgi:two-component system, OmpR family, sensor histidine kinase KdpD
MVTAPTVRDLGEIHGSRGRYKIFLGLAAGVGKTYRMLQEGHAAAEDGRDVAIGYLEAHGRAETLEQAEGLEVIPRRTVRRRDVTMTEMDLPAVLRRAPELCLIDELAHTNPPGLEHAKRYEDIADVLAAGIDVYSTVNVQHLESLNDQVAELTEIRVRETVPDSVLASADDVVVIDITPESLIERLRAGKVYSAERIQSALQNFFKIENLTALREVSLRQVAEEIEAKRLPPNVSSASGPSPSRDDERMIDSHGPSAIGERLLALVTPDPASQRIVRRAWRSAQRLGAELDLLWVSKREPRGDEVEQIEALRRLAGVLGAHLLIEHGSDVAEVAVRVARERGTTYVLMGRPNPRGALRRLSAPPLPAQLMSKLPGVDLRIVADRSQRRES